MHQPRRMFLNKRTHGFRCYIFDRKSSAAGSYDEVYSFSAGFENGILDFGHVVRDDFCGCDFPLGGAEGGEYFLEGGDAFVC